MSYLYTCDARPCACSVSVCLEVALRIILRDIQTSVNIWQSANTATCKINGNFQRFSTAESQFTTGTPSEQFPFILQVALTQKDAWTRAHSQNKLLEEFEFKRRTFLPSTFAKQELDRRESKFKSGKCMYGVRPELLLEWWSSESESCSKNICETFWVIVQITYVLSLSPS